MSSITKIKCLLIFGNKSIIRINPSTSNHEIVTSFRIISFLDPSCSFKICNFSDSVTTVVVGVGVVVVIVGVSA